MKKECIEVQYGARLEYKLEGQTEADLLSNP